MNKLSFHCFKPSVHLIYLQSDPPLVGALATAKVVPYTLYSALLLTRAHSALFKVLCYVGNRVPFWMQYCLNQQVAVSLRCVRAGQVRQRFVYTVLLQHQ
jgi:hypothetical protein